MALVQRLDSRLIQKRRRRCDEHDNDEKQRPEPCVSNTANQAAVVLAHVIVVGTNRAKRPTRPGSAQGLGSARGIRTDLAAFAVVRKCARGEVGLGEGGGRAVGAIEEAAAMVAMAAVVVIFFYQFEKCGQM